MRILLKIIGYLLLLVILIVAGGLIYLFTALPKKEAPQNVSIEATPERIARGNYLSHHVVVCVHCHSERKMQFFALPSVPGTEGQGGPMFLHPEGGPGEVNAPNITPYGLKDWTDGEIIRAVTSGVTKDGAPLFPMMPYEVYTNLKEEDLYSVIAYIRSLKPIAHEVPRTKLTFPLNLIVRTIPMPAKPHPEKQTNPGLYLVSIAGCAMCHTPVDEHMKPIEGMTFAGGQQFGQIRSANITPDPETGIGNWSKENFIAAFKKWQDPSLQQVAVPENRNTVMPWVEFSGMKEEDLGAIYDYLRTVRPIHHPVEKLVKTF